MSNKLRLSLLLLMPFFFAGCKSRNLVYFSDLGDQEIYAEEINSKPLEPTIEYGDMLNILVSSSNAEANQPFNRGSIQSTNNLTENNNIKSIDADGYLVDNQGDIDFPVLGQVHVGGMTKNDAKSKLTDLLKEYLNDPIITIRYLNYKITVLGEVNNPDTFTIPSERVNIIEALGMAGDMTVYGKRENVLLIKETGDKRKIVRLNLNDSHILDSPYYYLQPNDIVYVEPYKSKREQASLTRSNISIFLSVISALSLVLIRFN